MTVFALFGLACVGAIVATARGSSSAARIMALLLTGLWAGANHLALSGGIEALALLDLPVAVAAFALWFERREAWQAWLVVAMTARLLAHPLGVNGPLDWAVYLHTINALFLASLIAVAWNGGVRDVVDYCVRSLHRVCRWLAAYSSLVPKGAR